VPLHEKLKSIRLNQNISLEEISQRTRISLHILRALEQGDYSVLPMPYVRLFIRSIAREINFSPDEAIRILEADLQLAPTTPPEKLTTTPESSTAPPLGFQSGEGESHLFNESSWNRNLIVRIAAAVVVVIILVLAGRKLFRSHPSQPGQPSFALPAKGTVIQDSVKFDLSQRQDTLQLRIQARPFLAVIKEPTNDGPRDTVWLSDSSNFTAPIPDHTVFWFFPATNAFITLDQDTIYTPDQQFTGWGQIQLRDGELKILFMR